MRTMQVVEVNPKDCVRWKFADRSAFEFGDIHILAQDIVKHGQIEPVILRKLNSAEAQYEVIAGSRRWKACLEAGIPLKGIVQNLTDEQAAIAQIKENQQLPLCDYSKGIYYARLIKGKKITIARLAASIGCSKPKLQNFLAFDKVPKAIWEATGNLLKITSRTAATIYSLSQKGSKYIDALIESAADIRKGAGSVTLERKVVKIVGGDGATNKPPEEIVLPSGVVVARWSKGGIQFAKDLPFNQKAFEKVVIQFFEQDLTQ